jgi:alkyl sulfatase BDS1-like metallo-beta-lactamase superfamily hydrolase
MRTQRDTYAHLNNQVLHLANEGVTINQMHNIYKLPDSLRNQWAAHSYHGSEEHNSRAVINRYLGYWDANPATLMPLSPEDSAPLYVEMMGGADKIIKKGKQLYDEGKYFHATEILNKLNYADPKNQVAKDLLADVYEQIGYQKESPSVRNSFLAAAFELRHGKPSGASSTVGPDTIRGMTTGMWLDFLGVRLDVSKTEGKRFIINFITPDNNEKYLVELSNSALINIKGIQSPEADLTITMNRSELNDVMMGKSSFDDKLKEGKAKFKGDRKPYDELKSMLTTFTMEFELIPGTLPDAAVAPANENPFKQKAPADSSGG